jgi:hypothetical protein
VVVEVLSPATIERTANGEWRSNMGGVGNTLAIEELRVALDVDALYASAGA